MPTLCNYYTIWCVPFGSGRVYRSRSCSEEHRMQCVCACVVQGTVVWGWFERIKGRLPTRWELRVQPSRWRDLGNQTVHQQCWEGKLVVETLPVAEINRLYLRCLQPPYRLQPASEWREVSCQKCVSEPLFSCRLKDINVFEYDGWCDYAEVLMSVDGQVPGGSVTQMVSRRKVQE